MEKEELIEMINSTINTNGSGTITGESLNLALNAIVETMGTGTGSGGGAVWEKVSGTPASSSGLTVTTTEEDKAANIELINRCKQYIINGQPVMCYFPAVMNDESGEFAAGFSLSGPPTIYEGQLTFLGSSGEGIFPVQIAEDGSVTMQAGGL